MKMKILIIANDIFSITLKEKGKGFVEKYFNPLLEFEAHIVSFEDCYKYPSRKIGTLIVYPFCEKQFKRTWFYPWRIIRVLSRILLRTLRIIRIIKQEKIKLVRAYGMSILCFSGLIASKITRIPFVISLHSDYDKMFKFKGKLKGLLWHWLEKFIIMLSDFVIAVSPFLVEYTKKHGNRKVKYISNPIGIENFIKVGKERTLRKERKVLMFAGRFYDPQKNFERLLKAYSLIDKNLRENTKLIVFGDDGGKLEYFKNLTRKLGIEKNVKFMGKVPRTEMPKWYEKADFFIFPSLSEGFGYVIVEAMAAGMPVLTSTHPVCKMHVDGKNGVIVDPLRIEKIKEGLETLLQLDFKEYQKMCKNSFLKAIKYKDEKIYIQTASLYKRLIKE